MNFRLSEVGAALGLSQLKKLDTFITHRHNIATLYDEAFKNNANFGIIAIPSHIRSSHHLYPILSTFMVSKGAYFSTITSTRFRRASALQTYLSV